MLGDALEEQRRNNPMSGKTVADSATHCGGCGQQISEARRQAVPGCQLCTDCQNEANWLDARQKGKGWPR
jgi:phage/conjugal plasmid C-4 type zinc finger TraR family protein